MGDSMTAIKALNSKAISVAMTSYNHAPYIEQSIKSVWNQGVKEIVVVDDNSNDNSVELLNALQQISPVPIKIVIHQKNCGPAKSIKEAVENTTGEYVAFLASDDLFCPNRFLASLRILQDHPEVGAVYANGRVLNDKDGSLGNMLHGPLVFELLKKPVSEVRDYLYTHSSPLFLQAALVRRDVLMDSNAMSGDFLADDWITNIRIFEFFAQCSMRIETIDEHVCLYRVHGGNLHTQLERHTRLKFDVVEKITPPALQKIATGNIYWELGMSIIKRQPIRALGMLLKSQLIHPSWENLSSLLKKVCAR